MKSLRRSIATPREAKAMHSFGAQLTAEEGQGMTHDITNRADRWANRAGGDA